MSERTRRFAAAGGLLVLACQCTSLPNEPLNQPIQSLQTPASSAQYQPVNQPTLARSKRAHADLAYDETLAKDGLLIGMTFSGGGTRAAAYGYGILQEMEATEVNFLGHPTSLIDHVDILSGVSGGAVLAAYMGLHGRKGLSDFREKFLDANAEEDLKIEMGIDTLAAALTGGVNDATKLPRWLDAHLFHGATMLDLENKRPRHVYIYASDLFNRHPFVFSRASFNAICSDFGSYPISHAVAASAAVPIVFSPIVLRAYHDHCKSPLPDWVNRALKNREESEILRSEARGFRRNRDPKQVQYIKLADGGLSDNFGVTGFVIDHASEHAPYSPLNESQGVMVSRVLFLVGNAGPAPTAKWAQTLEGPSGMDMVNALSDTAIRSNVRANFEAFRRTFTHWREEMVRWRCSLPQQRVRELRGTLTGWNCRDLQFFITELAFDELGPERLKALSAVPTRFRLAREEVDLTIQAGRDVLRGNQVFQRFLASLPESRRDRLRAAGRSASGGM